jgi:hypothetical protein
LMARSGGVLWRPVAARSLACNVLERRRDTGGVTGDEGAAWDVD